MPILDLPSNPPPPPSPEQPRPSESAPVVIRSTRFGELAEHELVHLIDTMDDDRAKSRFRESIYISIIVYLIIGWLLIYGPKYILHQGKVVSPIDVLKERDHLTQLDTPQDIARKLARMKPPKPPVIDSKTIKQLQAMRRATPAPPTPAPPTPPAPTVAENLPPTPAPKLPVAPAPSNLPDVPRPTKQTFGNPSQSADQNMRDLMKGTRGSPGGDYGASTGRGGAAGTGVDVISDMQGVDFDAYIRRLLSDVKRSWIPLIPEEARPPLNKRGITEIRFTIRPDGSLAAMHLDDSTHDTAIDKAAWSAILGVGQFQPLPPAYKGNFELRLSFYLNTDPPR